MMTFPQRFSDKYRAVLFDLDGTLIDHFQAIHAAVAQAMSQMGLEPASYAKVKATVGGSIAVTMERLVGRELAPLAVVQVRAYLEEHWNQGIIVLPGAVELLRQLREEGRKVAVFTNKDGELARRVCAAVGLHRWVEVVVGERDTPYRKPMPEYTRHILQVLETAVQEACLIGDSPFDVAAAKCLGLDAYVVATGSHDLAALQKEPADGVFRDLTELARAVFPPRLCTSRAMEETGPA